MLQIKYFIILLLDFLAHLQTFAEEVIIPHMLESRVAWKLTIEFWKENV
jgi:hypothetical protein